MKTWSYGINSLYKTASIDLQTGPWWVFALERAVGWCCDLAPAIPLPDAKRRLRDQEDIELNGGSPWTTWKEWYGDLSQLFHGFVHMPVFNFCQSRIQSLKLKIMLILHTLNDTLNPFHKKQALVT